MAKKHFFRLWGDSELVHHAALSPPRRRAARALYLNVAAVRVGCDRLRASGALLNGRAHVGFWPFSFPLEASCNDR